MVLRAEFPHAAKPFLAFETLTLAPIDRACIDRTILSRTDRDWLDAYHARVLAEVGPDLGAPQFEWLERVCAPI